MEQVVDDFIVEAGDDEVGLWRVANAARFDFAKTTDADVRASSLEVMEKLIIRGVEIIDYYEGRGWEKWPEQSIEAILARIEREWNDLGRDQASGRLLVHDA